MKKVKDVDIDHVLTGTAEQGRYGAIAPPNNFFVNSPF